MSARHPKARATTSSGGMPAPMVHDSIELLATEVAPAIRKELGIPTGPTTV
jgi:hypothetical protein